MTAIERATILINPNARGVRPAFDGNRVVRYLGERGITARFAVPETVNEARLVASGAAARGDDVLFVVGGDGSLREAAASLAGSGTALAAIPGGTVNVFAREAGIPRTLKGALDAHLTGQTLRMDLGKGDGQRFLLMAGIGWDAEIVRRVSRGMKRRLGDVAYIIQGVRTLPSLRPHHTTWRWDHERIEAPLALMVLGNTRLYGGRVDLTPNAFANDGSLDLIALCPENIRDGARLAMKLAIGRLAGDRHVIEERITQVAIETPGLAVQFDGDFVGETPMAFEIEPGALAVRVPAGDLPAIFRPGQHVGASPG